MTIEIGMQAQFDLRDRAIAHATLHGWYPTTMKWMWVPQHQRVMQMVSRVGDKGRWERICQYQDHHAAPPEDCTDLWGWPSTEDLLDLLAAAGLRLRDAHP